MKWFVIIACVFLASPLTTALADGNKANSSLCGKYCEVKTKAEFKGKKVPTKVPMTCRWVRAPAPTAIVWWNGVPEIDNPDASIISFRVQKSMWRQVRDGVFERQICVPLSVVQNIPADLTICGEEAQRHFRPASVVKLWQQPSLSKKAQICLGTRKWCQDNPNPNRRIAQ